MEQDFQMIDFMLTVAGGPLEVAAAKYDPASGKVVRVREGKRKIATAGDYRLLRRWLRHENANGSNIWIRPVSPAHPIVMLDDLPPGKAVAITRKYRSIAVETSPGNSQALIVFSRPLGREERQEVARNLGRLVNADPGAISEPRWCRLTGFQQKKPGKSGDTRVLACASAAAQALDPAPHLFAPPAAGTVERGGGVVASSKASSRASAFGDDESRREFKFACCALERGMSPDSVEAAIAARVTATGRRKSRDYAARTVNAALKRLR